MATGLIAIRYSLSGAEPVDRNKPRTLRSVAVPRTGLVGRSVARGVPRGKGRRTQAWPGICEAGRGTMRRHPGTTPLQVALVDRRPLGDTLAAIRTRPLGLPMAYCKWSRAVPRGPGSGHGESALRGPDDDDRRRRAETFTKAPPVSFDPDATPPEPVRAHFPGEEPPEGLRVDDLGPGGESEPQHPPGATRRAVRRPPRPEQRPLRRLRPPLRPSAGPDRHLRRPPEPRRLALHPGLRPDRGRQGGADREEALLPLPAGQLRLLGRDAGLQLPLRLLPELGRCRRPIARASSRRAATSRPEQVVEEAVAAGVRSIAYTYVEPTVFIEFALDSMVRARAAGLHNVFVTNGYETPEAIELVAPYLDAANVDLKAANDGFYRRVCGARWEPVRDSVIEMRRRGIWLELTTLVIPGLNDDPRGASGHGRMDRHGGRARDALASHPLPAGLPARPASAHAGGDSGRSREDRPGGRLAPRLRRAMRPRWRRPPPLAPAAASG